MGTVDKTSYTSNDEAEPMAEAVDGSRFWAERMVLIKRTVLIWLTMQNSVHTLLVRYSRARPVEKMFLPSCAVFWMEVVKLVICLLAVFLESGGISRSVFSIVS